MWYIAVRGKKIVEPYLFHIRLFSVLVLHNFYRNIFIIDSIFPEETREGRNYDLKANRVVRGFSLGLTFFFPLTFHSILEYSQLRVNFLKDNPKVNVSWMGNEWNK